MVEEKLGLESYSKCRESRSRSSVIPNCMSQADRKQ